MSSVLISEHGRFSTTLRRLTAGDFIVGLYRIGRTPATTRPHMHPRASLSLILEGRASTHFSRSQSLCEPGVIDMEPAGMPHSHTIQSREMVWATIEVQAARVQSVPQLASRLTTPGAFVDSAPVEIFRRVVDELDRPGASQCMTIEGLALELLGSLVTERVRASPDGPGPRWLRDAVAAMAEKPESPCLQKLAATAGVHPAHFAREFRRHIGMSVGEFARQCRVRFAQQLLIAGDLSLSAIAHECGFADQSHFTRVFVRHTGRTPGQFILQRRRAGPSRVRARCR